MSGRRRGLVGPGYMPKGGRPAAAAHNSRVAGRAAAAPRPLPGRGDVREDVRASARPDVRSPSWRGPVAALAGLATGASAYGLLDWIGVF